MKYLYITFLFLNLFGANIFAQNSDSSFPVKGSVFDNDNTPFINATIAVYQGETLLTGTISDENGDFVINLNPGSYTIKVSFLAFTTHSKEIIVEPEKELNLGTITLLPDEASLDEIEVRGQRSYMEMDFDSRSFNVEQDITSLGGSALDVLDNVPSISTDFEGNVSLRGNQGVQILINGRPSNLVRNGTDALSSIPAGLIEEVKIITNPSARYAANGTGGINDIILIDGADLGFNGSIRANAGFPQDYGLGANMNYQKKNINWFLNTQVEYESQPESGSTFQSFSNDTTYAYSEDTDNEETQKEVSINLGADIFLKNDQILTLSTRVNLENQVEDSDINYLDYNVPNDQVYRDINSAWGVSQETDRTVYEEQNESDFDIRAQYEKKFNKSRNHRLTADLDFEFGKENGDINFDQIVQQGSGSGIQQRTNSGELYREVRLDVDYTQPIGDEGKFETGIRFDYEWQDNDYLVEELQSGNWIPSNENIGPADNFVYSENINAAYAIYSGAYQPFTYQFGLRVENTQISSELDQSGISKCISLIYY